MSSEEPIERLERVPDHPKSRILIVDDDDDLRRILCFFMEAAGHEVFEAMDGRAALRLLHDHRPALVLLDILLPLLDGWTVLDRIREVSDVPVLILSACTTESDKVRGLQSGADDYVTKPFSRNELLARADALMRRTRRAPERDSVYADEFLVVDLRQRSVQLIGRGELRLTPIEFRLLADLVRHRDQVVSQNELLESVWGDSVGLYRDQVKLRVSSLRRKLGQSPDHSCIETVRGFGYRYRTDRWQ